MSGLLADRYAGVVHRLAVGIEPRDALSDGPAGGARVTRTGARTAAQPVAHAGGRWSIAYTPALPATIELRIDDRGRHYVARRIAVTIVAPADVLAAEAAGAPLPAAKRVWRPLLYPGAAYPLAAGATGFRGRVVRQDGTPVPWTRIRATRPGSDAVLWHAHGDDRGEFLLIAGPDPGGPAELPATLAVTLTVLGRGHDDLPVELLAAAGDAASLGTAPPPGDGPLSQTRQDIDLIPGRVTSGATPFVLPIPPSARSSS